MSERIVSNFDAFPITNSKYLTSFINLQMLMPSEELSFLGIRKTLMDNNNSQSVVYIPLNIF